MGFDKMTDILKEIRKINFGSVRLNKSIYSVSNELLDNSRLHSSEHIDNFIEFGIFSKKDCIRVICVNIALEDDLFKLEKSFSMYNNSTRVQLKEEIKNRLLYGSLSKKNTIGTGLNIVRLKTKNKLLLSTEEHGKNQVKVLMDARIDKF